MSLPSSPLLAFVCLYLSYTPRPLLFPCATSRNTEQTWGWEEGIWFFWVLGSSSETGLPAIPFGLCAGPSNWRVNAVTCEGPSWGQKGTEDAWAAAFLGEWWPGMFGAGSFQSWRAWCPPPVPPPRVHVVISPAVSESPRDILRDIWNIWLLFSCFCFLEELRLPDKMLCIHECVHPCVCVCSVAPRDWFFATPWTVAHQAPMPVAFSRQECWSGLPFPSPGYLPYPGIEPKSPSSPALAGGFFPTEPPGKGVLFVSKKEWLTGPCYNMGEPRKHAEWKKPVTQDRIVWSHLYEMSPMDTEGRLVVAWHWVRWGLEVWLFF